MFTSTAFIVLSIINLIGLTIYPKSKNKLNGMKTIVLVLMMLSSYLALCGWISLRLLKRMSISVLCIFLFFMAVVLWFRIAKKKEIQKYIWRCADILGITVTMVFVSGIALHIFGETLSIRYSNAIGGRQFLDAMNLLRGVKVQGTVSFSTYIESVFVGIALPYVGNVQCYKAFLVAEIFLRALEMGMFYCVILTLSDKIIVRYTAPVIGIGYFFGYPVLSLLWANYNYWNGGALLFLWIIYVLLDIEKTKNMQYTAVVLLVEALLTDIVCAEYYAEFHMIGVAIVLLVLWITNRQSITNWWKKCGSLVGVLTLMIVACGSFYMEYFETLKNVEPTETETVGIYRCMYGDLLFFLPAFFVVIFYMWTRSKKMYTIVLVSVWSLIGTLTLYVLLYGGELNAYFYFLNYYNLWLIGWLLATMAMDIMAETKQLPMFYSYVGMMVVLVMLTLTNYDFHMWHYNVQYNGQYVTKNFLPLYRQSMDGLLTDYAQYEISEADLEVYMYMDIGEPREKIAIVTENEATQYWGDAFLGSQSNKYRLDKVEFPEVVQALSTEKVDAIVVMKDETQYQTYYKYYNRCKVLFENKQSVVYEALGLNWTDIEDTAEGYDEHKKELFAQAKMKDEQMIPLMADKSSYMDFIMYQNITGMDMSDYYTWKHSPVDNINNLNVHGIKQIVVLKDDLYYQTTKAYLDRQEIVYENEAGYILRCRGNSWSTQYK